MDMISFSSQKPIQIVKPTFAWNISDGACTMLKPGQYAVTGQEETVDGMVLLEVNHAFRFDRDQLESAA